MNDNILKKRNTGTFAVVFVILLAIIFWIIGRPLPGRFENYYSIFLELTQLSGLVGYALFAVTLILSVRSKKMEKYFGGLNRVYVVHHLTGGLALSFLLFHPLFSALRFLAVSWQSAFFSLIPGYQQPNITIGSFALAIMLMSLFFTFYVFPSYPKWKFLHKFLGVAFIFAAMHAFLAGTDTNENFLIRYYFLLLTIIALVVYFYRSIFSRMTVKRFEYVVVEVRELNEQVIEIALDPVEEKMVFEPGQFVFTSFVGGSVTKESHPFSISSGREEKTLRITVKKLGDYTAQLKNVSIGEKVLIEGPFGVFTPEKTSTQKQIWIAGGIGITPFLSVVRSGPKSHKKVSLFYSVRDKEETIYFDYFTEVSSKSDNFSFFGHDSLSLGRLTASMALSKSRNDPSNIEVFICGPISMMNDLKKQFRELGVPSEKIITEDFGFSF